MFTAAGVDLLMKGGLFNRTGYIAAMSNATTELTQTSYARIAAALTNWRRSGRMYVNDGVLDFPTPGAAWPLITHWRYLSAATGGTIYLTDNLEVIAAAPGIGANVGFDDATLGAFFVNQVQGGLSTTSTGAIDDDDTTLSLTAVTGLAANDYLLLSSTEVVQVTSLSGSDATITRGQLGTVAMAHASGASAVQVDDEFTEMGSAKAFSEGLVSGTRYLALSQTKPADALGSSLIDDPISVSESEWTASTQGSRRRVRNNVVKSYGAQATDEPVPMWVALADGNVAASNVLWRRQFNTTPGDPGLGDVIRHPVNSLELAIFFA